MADSELMASERLKNMVKLTGDIEIDVIANMEALLDEKFKPGRSMDIYTTDTDKIPTFPAISIDLVNSETRQRTMGKDRATFERNVYIDIFYYHADVNNKNVESETRIALSRLNSILARNADLNGYCRMGMRDAKPSRILDKVFGDKIVKSGVISKLVIILYRDRAAGPGAKP